MENVLGGSRRETGTRRRGVLIAFGCLLAVEAALQVAVRFGPVAASDHRFLADSRYASYVQYVVPRGDDDRFYRIHGAAAHPVPGASRVLWLFGGPPDLEAGERISAVVLARLRERSEDWTVVDLTQPEYVLDQSRALFLEVLKHGRTPDLAVFLAGVPDVTTTWVGLPVRAGALADIFDAVAGRPAPFVVDLISASFKLPVVIEHLSNLPFQAPAANLDRGLPFGPRRLDTTEDVPGALAGHLEHNRRLIETLCREFGFPCRFVLAGLAGDGVRLAGNASGGPLRLLRETGDRLQTTGHWSVTSGTGAEDSDSLVDPAAVAAAIIAVLDD